MRKKGFTLIELLAVVLIMGILTAVAVPQYRKSLERSRIAEAMQMLPAIYDARERLISERGYLWSDVGANGLPTWASSITFPKIDISMKGKQKTDDANVWETDNFSYTLMYNGTNSSRKKYVSAQLKKGRYKDTGLNVVYDGSKIFCIGGTSNDCEALGITGGTAAAPL